MKLTLDAIKDKKFLSQQMVEHNRWTITYEVVFEHGGKFYRAHYFKPATEYQDCPDSDWDEELKCEEVHQVNKVVQVWEPIQS